MKNKLSNVKFQKKKAFGIHSILNVDKNVKQYFTNLSALTTEQPMKNLGL